MVKIQKRERRRNIKVGELKSKGRRVERVEKGLKSRGWTSETEGLIAEGRGT